MPIEIRELIIKANVTREAGPAGAGAASPGNNNTVTPGEEAVQATLEKVMELIKDKKER